MLVMIPVNPVKGSISPIFIIATAKLDLKVVGLLLYSETMEYVDPPVNKT